MALQSDHRSSKGRRAFGLVAAVVLMVGLLPGTASAEEPDPRIGLGGGWLDAQSAISNLEMLAHLDRPPGFVNPANPGDFGLINSDLAFSGNHAFVGSYNGFNVVDISDPAHPTITTSVVCPGGQGDMTVHGNLLFMSVEENRGRIDCGTQGTVGQVDPNRFRGVRIFDISDIANPVQVGGVQTCRGSHTHTLVTDPNDSANVYIYNSGTSSVRNALELPGCENAPTNHNNPVTTGNPTQWRIDVIKVPLAAPQNASIVSQPRIFTDPVTGAYNGLQNTISPSRHPSGSNYSPVPNTNTCHDITAFPEVGLAAGACQGNGILLDISDPVNPVRLDAVADPNYSYWHSATLNNDGTKVIFTDEWGGGTGARCRTTDQPEWGANAVFDIVDRKMQFRSYYKLPVPQTVNENCVAHNGSLLPVPGRDIMVQAWYQGGISLVDYTDSAHPQEIAYFDRGPIPWVPPSQITLGGFWSAYWYNGNIHGSEIARGFDVFGLMPSAHMSESEIAAASQVQLAEFNAQHQTKFTWAPSFAVARSYYDQAVRADNLGHPLTMQVDAFLARAERFANSGQTDAAVSQLQEIAGKLTAPQHQAMKQAILNLAASL